MASVDMQFAGYFFGVKTGDKVTEYPNYTLAAEALVFRRLDGRIHTLKMRAVYHTPWIDAKEHDNEN